jgi:putative intracellular protease/amidase
MVISVSRKAAELGKLNGYRASDMRILMVLTSHAVEVTDTSAPICGLHNFAAAYFVFRDAGAELLLASPEGGLPAFSLGRESDENLSEVVSRFYSDSQARSALADTLRLEDIYVEDFDAVFYPGGLGSLWDLADNKHSIMLISAVNEAGKPIGLVAHGPAALCGVRSKDGKAFVSGRKITATSKSEDNKIIKKISSPFDIETELIRLGAFYSSTADWNCNVVTDGMLITGQNSASVAETARALLTALSG